MKKKIESIAFYRFENGGFVNFLVTEGTDIEKVLDMAAKLIELKRQEIAELQYCQRPLYSGD